MQPTNKRTWKPRFSLRLMLVLCVILGLLFAYAGSYYRLSRRGMAEAREYELAGFFYIPFDEFLLTRDLTPHHRLAMLFAPANWVDQILFGAPGPSSSFLVGFN
jgi:hypothetical protein